MNLQEVIAEIKQELEANRMVDNCLVRRLLLAYENAKAELDHAWDCVDKVFQSGIKGQEPILPGYAVLGENKFDAVVRLAEAFAKQVEKNNCQRNALIEIDTAIRDALECECSPEQETGHVDTCIYCTVLSITRSAFLDDDCELPLIDRVPFPVGKSGGEYPRHGRKEKS